MLIASLETAEHVHISSRFQKTPEKKLSRADWQAVGPPYIPSRRAEIDVVMSNRRAQNIIKDVENDISTAFPNDHFPVNIRIKINLVNNKKKEKRTSTILEKPVTYMRKSAAGFAK